MPVIVKLDLDFLARGLVVREINRQDVARLRGTRVKDFTVTAAELDGYANAVYRVVNAYGPQQVLEAVHRVVGLVPVFTAAGRQAWLQERVESMTVELHRILRDEARA